MTARRWQAGPLVWCLVAAGLFGASTPAAKRLVSPLGPVLLSGLLYAGAALAVLPAVWAQRAKRDRVRSQSEEARLSSPAHGRINRWRLAGAVGSGGVVGPILLFWGLSLAPAGSVSLWLTLETVATAVLARLLFREHLETRGWIAVALVVLASVALSGDLHRGAAAGLVALACLAWGLDNNLTSLIDGYTPAEITLVKGTVVALGAIPVGWALGGQWGMGQVVAALGVGALGYGGSLVLYVAGAQQLGATRSQLVFSTSPLFGLVLAWAALGESVGWVHGAAAAMMAVALWLLRREHHAHEHEHHPAIHTHWHRHDDGHHDHQHVHPAAHQGWHQHEHQHEGRTHCHAHRPDVHHRHQHP
jgi:drug/metabolite transporter (DMT)-like permease